ncbi:hypothetical protein EGI22_01745 [Lacihabitans sp. LS3-19]|uniref:carboxypeptidase-like regulatory domain-containing protein n=1 Tax=Lacihabitans sp. LS3-19 TaxID=2487335 RepID=UPI0020CFE668|nr:carboxypeptidase-like regulatory domain-containing protein [Lacihabitans sp. LS3-19]MCP9766612.1 hypothetical protein [Lacihabitans sp. LS3-19]
MKNFKLLNVLIVLLSFAISSAKANRNIGITGIIMDSENLQPIENANIYDESAKFLGTTDARGFFNIAFSKDEKGEIYFKLKVMKDGYDSFLQNEHWGDLSENIYGTFYIGMKNKTSKNAKVFSELKLNDGNVSYNEVLEGFKAINEKLEFDKSIEGAKEGNENVFFELGNRFYIISETSWVEIKSGDENILINNMKSIKAKDLNGLIKRSKINNMTTLNREGLVAGIFTNN